MRAAGEVALYGGISSALKFLETEDGMERALIQGIAHQAIEISRELDTERAEKIAAEVSKIFG